jgi:hypothetical protein
MHVRNAVSGLALLACASLLASCTGGSSSIPAPVLTTTTVTAADPTGDTNAGALGTIYDVTSASASRLITGATTLTLTFTFVQPVLLPAPGASVDPAGTQLGAFIVFNIADTGGVTFPGYCGALTAYPHISYQVAMFTRLADGNYTVTNNVPATTGEATPTVLGTTLILTVPLSAIGGTTGTTKFAAAVGNFGNPTDCVPNSGMIGPI